MGRSGLHLTQSSAIAYIRGEIGTALTVGFYLTNLRNVVVGRVAGSIVEVGDAHCQSLNARCLLERFHECKM